MAQSKRSNYKMTNNIMIQLKFERDNLRYKLDRINYKINRCIRDLKDCEDEYIRNKWDTYCEEANYNFSGDEKKVLFDKIKNESNKWKNIVNNNNDIELDEISKDMYNVMVKSCSKIKSLNRKRDKVINYISKTEKQMALISEYEDIHSTSI